MKKNWILILLCLFAMMSLSACNNNNEESDDLTNLPEDSVTEEIVSEEGKIKVSATFDAMKEFVQAVGKDKVEISTIIPTGADSHDFEPKAQDLITISNADIFVYNGLGMEGWAEEAISAANNPDLIIVDSSIGADLIERGVAEEDDHDHEDDHDQEDDHDHSHGKYDPHLWLGLKGAQTQVKNIRDALVQADPSNKDYYEQNSDDYISQLENLYNEYIEKFQDLEKKSFVTGHAAFGYLARDFGLKENSVRDVFAEGEPSAQQMTQLVEYCRENNVTTIFSEEMVSQEVSQTLANEVGARVETIYTIEYPQDDMTYIERMEINLSNIYESLID